MTTKPTPPAAITPVPTPVPLRTDRANFAARGDSMMGWFEDGITEIQAGLTYTNQAVQFIDEKATAAAAALALAQAAAAAAAASAGATLWVTGTNYTAGAVVYSPTNYATYRTTTSGTSSTDPAADTSGRWVSAMLPSAEAIGLPNIRPTLLLDFVNGGEVDPRLKVTRSTTKTRINEVGLRETLLANALAVDYHPYTKAARGLRLDLAAANIITYPRALNSWASAGGGTTVNANSAVASDGTTTADEVVAVSGASCGRTLDVTLTAAKHALKLRVRAGTASSVSVGLYNAVFTGVTATILDGPGTVTGTGLIELSGLSSIVYTTLQLTTGTVAAGTWAVYIAPNLAAQAAADSVVIDWVQLEIGTACGSDIPEGVSRVADEVEIDFAQALGLYNQPEGALVVGFVPAAVTTTNGVAAIGNASSYVWQGVYMQSPLNITVSAYNGASDESAASFEQASLLNVEHIAGIAWAKNNFDAAANGVAAANDNSGTPISGTRLFIGNLEASGSFRFSGWITFVALYAGKMTAAELAALTYRG